MVCVRYRYDEQGRKRGGAVEIIVEEFGWSPPEKPVIVGLRVERVPSAKWRDNAYPSPSFGKTA
ncbi:MAG: hypothetical protein ACREP5_13070 [Candidatus Binatia bacterium]